MPSEGDTLARLIVRAMVWIIVICALALFGFGLLTIPPGIKLFKEDGYDRLEHARTIKDPSLLQSMYGRLENGRDVDYFTFRIERSMSLRISIKNVAADDSLEPAFILFGPGISKPTESLPIEIGEPNGARIARTERNKQRPVFEVSELTTYLTGPTLMIEIREPGTYALAVVTSNQTSGRYVVTIGDRAERGLLQQIRSIPDTLKVALRLY